MHTDERINGQTAYLDALLWRTTAGSRGQLRLGAAIVTLMRFQPDEKCRGGRLGFNHHSLPIRVWSRIKIDPRLPIGDHIVLSRCAANIKPNIATIMAVPSRGLNACGADLQVSSVHRTCTRAEHSPCFCCTAIAVIAIA